jgi:hypothetical protein
LLEQCCDKASLNLIGEQEKSKNDTTRQLGIIISHQTGFARKDRSGASLSICI